MASRALSGEAVALETGKRPRKKVLVIVSYPLSPDRDAGSLRMYNLLQLFRGFAWQATFAVSDLQSSPAQHDLLQALGVDVLETPPVESVEVHLQEHGPTYDLVIMSALPVALKYLSCIRRNAAAAKLVFDTTDLQHLREYRRAKVTGEGGWLQLAMRSRKWELAAVNAADCTWVVSPTERAVLEKACPNARIQLLSVIQAIHGSARAFAERRGIVFIGSFPHHPNADAMRHFVDRIYPLLKEQINGEKVFIIGPEPPDWLRERAADDLIVLGHVPDIKPYFDDCRISIAPLRYGAGVNGKILLSMSHGVPVVASSVAAEGIPLAGGEDILVADSPGDFCGAVMNLYHNERLWGELSRNGLGIVERHYSVEASRSRLAGILEDLELD